MDLLESFAGQPTNALNGAPDSRKLIARTGVEGSAAWRRRGYAWARATPPACPIDRYRSHGRGGTRAQLTVVQITSIDTARAPRKNPQEENETLRDENQHLRELFADALARIRELEEAERDGDEASSAGAASEESVPAESDSEDDLPLAALRRRLAARDDDASESEEEDASESEEDASESEEEADARPRKRPRTTAAPRTRERTSKYYGEPSSAVTKSRPRRRDSPQVFLLRSRQGGSWFVTEMLPANLEAPDPMTTKRTRRTVTTPLFVRMASSRCGL